MRSTIAILVICTFAYLAHSQNTCASPAPAGCASCTGLAALPNQCTSCSSGYLLSGAISACGTACGTGCWSCTNSTVCLVCNSGYTLYSTTGVCVALPTGCTAGNATNATAVTCTATWSNYTLNTGVPVACGGTVNSTVGSTTWQPVLNCVACTATAATTTKLQNATVSGSFVTCSQCANGYILFAAQQQACGSTCAAAPGIGVSTPECVTNAGVTQSGLATGAANYIVAAASLFGSNVGCAQGSVTYAAGTNGSTANSISNIMCSMAASGYWCPQATALATTACATTGTPVPTSAPTNCLGGLSNSSAATSANIICQWCTNSSFYLNGTTGGNACVANNASCLTQVSATNCTMAAPGYTLVNGIVTVCSNTTTSCTGGVLSTQILLATGATITGTAVTGCQYHNASGVCVQCGGYVSSVQNCTACPSNCVNCTLSSGTTSCTSTGCSSGYSLLSNGSCAAACANGTNRSSNGSCVAYGKNMIASAVAFASLVFYYIF